MDELKPCPFCGGKSEIFRGVNENQHTIRCTQCAMKMPTMLNEKDAVAAWNRRPEPENKPLTLEQLRQMDREPVYSSQCGWGIIGFRKFGTDEHGGYDRKYTVGFSYGWEWLDDVLRIGPLYARKPEQEEK